MSGKSSVWKIKTIVTQGASETAKRRGRAGAAASVPRVEESAPAENLATGSEGRDASARHPAYSLRDEECVTEGRAMAGVGRAGVCLDPAWTPSLPGAPWGEIRPQPRAARAPRGGRSSERPVGGESRPRRRQRTRREGSRPPRPARRAERGETETDRQTESATGTERAARRPPAAPQPLRPRARRPAPLRRGRAVPEQRSERAPSERGGRGGRAGRDPHPEPTRPPAARRALPAGGTDRPPSAAPLPAAPAPPRAPPRPPAPAARLTRSPQPRARSPGTGRRRTSARPGAGRGLRIRAPPPPPPPPPRAGHAPPPATPPAARLLACRGRTEKGSLRETPKLPACLPDDDKTTTQSEFLGTR
ncbi:proline-rich protein 2-like [Suncus etruscus]|uniref:proline-rich protein 2-like n=1 Tax=Suncus etruscus TaxID=109475 RepID=UPI002110621D|nr:proline-rich protein 2-like [Suncus etruscus]